MNGHLHIAVILCVKVLQRKKFLLKSERIPWICIISYSRKLQQIPEARETTSSLPTNGFSLLTAKISQCSKSPDSADSNCLLHHYFSFKIALNCPEFSVVVCFFRKEKFNFKYSKDDCCTRMLLV